MKTPAKPTAPAKPERPVLRRGDSGPIVSKAQTLLANHRLPPFGAPPLEAGFFNRNMEACVKTFQALSGLKINGMIGNQTWSKLDEPGDAALAAAGEGGAS